MMATLRRLTASAIFGTSKDNLPTLNKILSKFKQLRIYAEYNDIVFGTSKADAT